MVLNLELLRWPPILGDTVPVDPRLDAFLSRCLLLDLETGPHGEILDIGELGGASVPSLPV